MTKPQAQQNIYDKYTPSQREVILSRGKSMLVSASAGTGKTTVMIERIAKLIKDGLDISQIVVVTFTNLAATEMKSRLASKLGEFAQSDARIGEQLEKLDNSAICTLHSFCCDLLRNYFYVVDVDPSFTILDTVTVNALQKTALENLFKDYFQQKDKDFQKLYKIYSTHRKEDNFKKLILQLHAFSRCLVDFPDWYSQMRDKFQNYSPDNQVVKILLQDLCQKIGYFAQSYRNLVERAQAEENMQPLADTFLGYYQALKDINLQDLQQAMLGLCKATFPTIPRRGAISLRDADKVIEEQLRLDHENLSKAIKTLKEFYSKLSRGLTVEDLWKEMADSLSLTDKLVEMVVKFDQEFYSLKKQRGGVDFNDLEHKTLQLLADGETLQAIRQKYKMVFVDEYQDTNYVQEAIVSLLVEKDSMFMVGDVKQSIYGFRGCEPSIFVNKQRLYSGEQSVCQQADDAGGKLVLSEPQGQLITLNANFRSNVHILQFVNTIFNPLMTEKFGKVDYVNTAQLEGRTPPSMTVPSVQVDFVLKADKQKSEITQLYDITQPTQRDDGVTQANLIANNIKRYVGKLYKDKNGSLRPIGYGDVVILMRGLTAKATDIYNVLVEQNIPVTANFKTLGYVNKEVREMVNLLRVLDNPYNDVYLAGVCLCSLGGFTENDLAQIRLNTKGKVPFFDRLLEYSQVFDDGICNKINCLLQLLDSLRFYSRGASVCELLLKILQSTSYHLYVQGFPNGALRLEKLYSFIDGLKDAPYAQSIDKFLEYVDDAEDTRAEEALSATNAVRLMTMHASKGLEFPVVILAGVETSFRFDENVVERNASLGLASKYYDFANMKRCQTLGYVACSLYNKTKQREEEMRLLYVAMTRAKFVLNIVGTVTQGQLDSLPKMPQDALSHLDWILYSLKNSYQGLQQEGQALTIQVVEQVANEQTLTQDFLCQQYTDKDWVLQQLAYQYPFQGQTQMPLKVVSSALDKQYLEDEQLKPVPVIVADDRNKVGTAYHTVYQFVDYDADVLQIQSTIQSLVAQGKMESSYAQQLDVNLIFATLQNPQLRQIMSSGKVYHEIPFMLYAPYDQLAKDKRFSDNVILQGVIDMLVIGNDCATVVDFKYTSRSDKVAERYPYQLNSYRLAVQQICGIDKVDCYVLSIADNKLIKM